MLENLFFFGVHKSLPYNVVGFMFILDSFKTATCLIQGCIYALRGRKEGNVLFNDALNTFYLWLYGITHIVKDHSDSEREETRCRYMGYSFRLAAWVLLYASSHTG